MTSSPLTLVRGRDPDEDQVLYVNDIVELLRHAKSAWWVRNYFAPDRRFKVGRSPAWWRKDALAWLNQRPGAK